jgi:hypothetical protein
VSDVGSCGVGGEGQRDTWCVYCSEGYAQARGGAAEEGSIYGSGALRHHACLCSDVWRSRDG